MVVLILIIIVVAVALRVRYKKRQFAYETDGEANGDKEKLTGRDDGNDSATRLDSLQF